MKIDCPCGAKIKDQTDELPHKAHLIADQDWFAVFDAIDAQVIDPLREGRLEKARAYILMRNLISRSAQNVYQCRECGRLFLDRERTREVFVPEGEHTDREALRRRPDPA